MSQLMEWTPAARSNTSVTSYQPRGNGVALTAPLPPTARQFLITSPVNGMAYDVRTTFADGHIADSVAAVYTEAAPAAKMVLRAGSYLGSPVGTADWSGWDPNSIVSPPNLPAQSAWWTNTGVFDSAERAALTVVNGGFTTTAGGTSWSNPVVIDGKRFKGKVTIAHPFVIAKRCVMEPTNAIGIESTVPPGPGSPKVWHCDIGNGAAGDYVADGTKGFFTEIKRCDFFGWNDAISAKSQIAYTNTHMHVRDNYMHDMRQAGDDSFGTGENTHNDFFQLSHVRYQDILNNTCVGWTFNNYTQSETCNRQSGPNWTPGSGPLDFTGNLSGSANPSDGYMTSAYQGSDQLQQFVVIDGNIMRGHFANAVVLRGASGNSYTVRNNRFQRNAHQISNGTRRNVLSFLSGATATLGGNVDVDGASMNA